MKKSVIFIMFLLCGLLLCSCCKNRDNKKPSDTGQKAVSSSISENTSLNNESKPQKNGGTVSSNSKSERKTNSETAVADVGENQSSISDSSAKGEVPPLDADEYELPFIPN